MIFDLHNDYPTSIKSEDYGNYIRLCGNNIVTAAIWTSDMKLDSAYSTVENTISALVKLKSPSVPIAIEDLTFLSDRDKYSEFDFSRLLYCSLTWNYNNRFAGGALDDGQLTTDGTSLVKCINGKCAVDLAHLNKSSFYRVLEIAEDPICSHTGFNSHLRSLDDAQIKALCARNAIIGLSAVETFTDARSLQEWVCVIDRFVQKYDNGVNILAIGTDFYGSTHIPPDLRDYTAECRIKNELYTHGYSAEAVDKILYKNALKFFNGDTK